MATSLTQNGVTLDYDGDTFTITVNDISDFANYVLYDNIHHTLSYLTSHHNLNISSH